MCLAGYFIPVTMVVSYGRVTTGETCSKADDIQASVVNMEFVTDFESNDRYLNHTVPNLERYHTVVGTKVDQVSDGGYIRSSRVAFRG